MGREVNSGNSETVLLLSISTGRRVILDPFFNTLDTDKYISFVL